MNFLSKTQYENESDYDELIDVLVDISLPNIYFAKAAIYAAKSVQHLIVEKDKEVCLKAIEIAEKHLRGEVTQEECLKAADAAYALDDYAPQACAFAAYAAAYTVNAACYVSTVTFKAACALGAYKVVNACNMLKRAITWNLVCSFQIAKCFGNQKNEQFIQEIIKDENLINYATIILEDENLRKEFKFLMNDYVNK